MKDEKSKRRLSEQEAALKLFVVLSRATKALQDKATSHIEECGLNLSDFAILEALFNKGSLPISTIGAKVLLTNGSMTAAIDRLEQKGLVERKAHETDRRTKLIDLTKKGRNLIAPVFAEHAQVIESACAGLNKEDKLAFIELAKKLGKYAMHS